MLEVFSAQEAVAAVMDSPPGSQLWGQMFSTWQCRVHWCEPSCRSQTIFLGAWRVSDNQKPRTAV